MLTAKTYYVTLTADTRSGFVGGLVKRLDNLTGPWIDVSLPLSLPGATVRLYDVETDPTNGDKVFTVGSSIFSRGYFGIFFSTDGGVTWQVPAGNYQTVTNSSSFQWNEVTVVDSSTIFVAGSSGYICKSTDGGLTFNLCTRAPALPATHGGTPAIQDCQSIHFITPLNGVVGMVNNFIMTSDGGITWTPCCGGAGIEAISSGIPNPGIIYGIHLDITSQIVVCTGTHNIARTTDAGVTFSTPYTWANNNGIHLTWEDDLRLWSMGLGSERIRSTDGGATWTVVNSYLISNPANIAGHFYLADNGFISSGTTISSTTNGGISGITSDVSPVLITAIWTYYSNQSCYLLTDCDSEVAPFIVNNDLSAVVGGTVQLCSDNQRPSSIEGSSTITTCKCFKVSTVDSCNGAVTVTVSASYPDCISCKYCYILTDCTNPDNVVITSNDLSTYLGKIIKLQECPDTCWEVSRSHNCPNTKCVSPVIAVFETCDACLPPPIPLPVPELNLRRVKPGYNTPGCDPAYTETVSCTYAKAVYDHMIINRYGVTMCCNEDVDKWYIKKQLLNLKAIYDPNMCKSTLNTCCPPCAVTAELRVFTPVSCQAPTTVTAELRIPSTCPSPTSITGVDIIINQYL